MLAFAAKTDDDRLTPDEVRIADLSARADVVNKKGNDLCLYTR